MPSRSWTSSCRSHSTSKWATLALQVSLNLKVDKDQPTWACGFKTTQKCSHGRGILLVPLSGVGGHCSVERLKLLLVLDDWLGVDLNSWNLDIDSSSFPGTFGWNHVARYVWTWTKHFKENVPVQATNLQPGSPSAAPRAPVSLPHSWCESAHRASSGLLWICPRAQSLEQWPPTWTQHVCSNIPKTKQRYEDLQKRTTQQPFQGGSKLLVGLNEPLDKKKVLLVYWADTAAKLGFVKDRRIIHLRISTSVKPSTVFLRARGLPLLFGFLSSSLSSDSLSEPDERCFSLEPTSLSLSLAWAWKTRVGTSGSRSSSIQVQNGFGKCVTRSF